MVAPAGARSIAMTRDCFESGLALLVLALPAGFGKDFAGRAGAAGDTASFLLADIAIGILLLVRFCGGIAPHHRSPTSAMEPAGQDPKSRVALGTGDSTAPMAARCQSFLDNNI